MSARPRGFTPFTNLVPRFDGFRSRRFGGDPADHPSSGHDPRSRSGYETDTPESSDRVDLLRNGDPRHLPVPLTGPLICGNSVYAHSTTPGHQVAMRPHHW